MYNKILAQELFIYLFVYLFVYSFIWISPQGWLIHHKQFSERL